MFVSRNTREGQSPQRSPIAQRYPSPRNYDKLTSPGRNNRSYDKLSPIKVAHSCSPIKSRSPYVQDII